MATPASLYRQLPATRQRTRRTLTVAAFAGYPLQIVGYATLVATGILAVAPWAIVTVLLFSATLVGMVGVYGYGQGRMGERDRLDERQRLMVDQALIRAYAALTTVIVVVAGILGLSLSFVGPITLDMSSVTPWLIAIGLYVPFVPFAALAWIEPDAPVDDEA